MKLPVQPFERCPHIIYFANPIVMLTLAQSRSAKIEAQHGEAEAIQRLHDMENDFVVQGPAVVRVRVADQASVARLGRACVEHRLQSPGRPVEKEGVI